MDANDLPGMDASLMQPDTSWWAKHGQAKRHVDHLRKMYDEFRAREPLYVAAEPTDDADRIAYRLHIRESIPLEISLILGDLVHNLRSALDSFVFELVRRDRGQLTDAEEKACQFPVTRDPATFEEFFAGHGTRNRIFPQYLRDVIREVQPFRILEVAKSMVDIAADLSYDDEFRHHGLAELVRLSNVDKHRRLALTAWWPDLIYWMSDGESNRRWIPGDGTFADGSIVGYVIGRDDGQSDVFHQFNLIVTDLPSHVAGDGRHDDVMALASGWVNLVGSVLRRLVFHWTRAQRSAASGITWSCVW